MPTSIRNVTDFRFENYLLTALQHFLPPILADLGKLDLHAVSLRPVDNYHRATAYLYLDQEADAVPVGVVKTANPDYWDNTKELLLQENQMHRYAAQVVPELVLRQMTIYADPKNSRELVFYPYLGPSAAQNVARSEIYRIADMTYKLLNKLHTHTKSRYPGTDPAEPIRAQDTNTRIAELTTRYFLNDIQRERIDQNNQLTNYVKETWFPIFEHQSIYALAHRDITLSNIIILPEGNITFIDWTYSAWQDPTYDLANILFWVVKYCGAVSAFEQYAIFATPYQELGFQPDRTLPYFLARKFIDYGRFKGNQFVEYGKHLIHLKDDRELSHFIAKNQPPNE